MDYRITGLDPALFDALRHASDDALAARHARRVVADAENAFPCRISLTDAKVGDTLLLLNFEHLSADSPYRSRHAIYINESSGKQAEFVNEVPAQLRRRLLSVRAFDAQDMIVDAEVVEGEALEPLIGTFLADARVAYLHVHNARRGCFAARVDRT